MSDETVSAIEVSPRAAAELVAAGAELIDVRREDEWDAGRLEGARRVEMNELPAAAATLDPDRALVFYCRVGNRSLMAAEAFREAGYEAFSLAGGLEAWAADGLELQPPGGEVRAAPPPS